VACAGKPKAGHQTSDPSPEDSDLHSCDAAAMRP
jgi:hypothetical protein